MNEDLLNLRQQAQNCLNEMSIMDGDAFINNTLFELSETDESSLEIKKQTLAQIQKLLKVKNKIKIKNNDFYFLKTIAEQLRLEETKPIESSKLEELLDVIKRNF